MQTTRLLLTISAVALLVSCAAERERWGRHRHRPRDVGAPPAAAVARTAGQDEGSDLPLADAQGYRRAVDAFGDLRRARIAGPAAAAGPVTQNVDPRILKHRNTEFVADPVAGVFFDLELRPPAKVVTFYASPPSLFLETDGRPDAMPLGTRLTESEPDPPAYAMTADAGVIRILETAPPHRQGRLVLEDKYGGGLHYVDAVLGHWQLATDTVIWVSSHATMPGDPPKKRLWTVETGALQKLLPPTDAVVTAAGSR